MSKEVVRRKSGKREALLAAAERLFLEKGVHAVTVEEVVGEAGVSKATFYKYFAGKETLVEAVMDMVSDVLVERLMQLVQRAKQERMTKEDFIGFFDVNEYDRFFNTHFIEDIMKNYPHVVLRAINKLIGTVFPIFRDLIRAAKIDGIVRLDVDTEMLLVYTVMLRRAVAQNWMLLPEGMEIKDFTSKMWDIYLYGIMDQKEKSPAPEGTP